MTRVVIAVLLCAGFFVLHALLPQRACTGHCEGCTGSCERFEKEGDHVVR